MSEQSIKHCVLLKACRDAMAEAAEGPTDWTHMIAAIDAALSTPSHVAPKTGLLKLAHDYLTLERTLLSGDEIKELLRAFVQAEESRATNARLLDESLQRLHSAPSTIAEKQEAVGTLEQALLEMHHSYTNPQWFTKGESGAAAQFRLWHGKGLEAIRVLKRETTPPATLEKPFVPIETAYYYRCDSCKREVEWQGPNAEINVWDLSHTACGTVCDILRRAGGAVTP